MENQSQNEIWEKQYNEKINHFIGSIPNSRFIIEVSKFCGYSEFVLVFKNQTLLDLYKTISIQFECNDVKGLYVTKSKKYKIPVTDNIRLRDYIYTHQKDLIKPVYPHPLPVVYKFFLDDGHYCIDDEENLDH